MRVGVSSASPSALPSAKGARRVPAQAGKLDDLAHQREAVRVNAGGGEAEDDIALGNVAGRQKLAPLGGTDRKAREIVIAGRVHARHFRRLAADQCTARLAAAGGNAADDRRALIRIELAGREIVEEEKRLRALHDEIVDAHRHEVDADRLMIIGVDRDLQLGADAVIGGDENRIGEAGGLEVEQAAEAADFAVGAGAARGAHGRLDLLHQKIAGIDIDACVAIGQAVFSRLAHADLRWLSSGGILTAHMPVAIA